MQIVHTAVVGTVGRFVECNAGSVAGVRQAITFLLVGTRFMVGLPILGVAAA